MFSKSIKFNAALAVLLLAPSLAFAHTGVGETIGFAHGFSHPLSGLDHVLAMVMVGVLALQLGGRAVWIVPATFVGVMAAGGALGMMGIAIPFVEAGIALSVLVLGAVIAFNIRAPVAAIAAAVVGLFAIFHGHAHGAEMPAAAGGMAYATGFMIATVALHIAGITMGYGLAKMGETRGAFVTRASRRCCSACRHCASERPYLRKCPDAISGLYPLIMPSQSDRAQLRLRAHLLLVPVSAGQSRASLAWSQRPMRH
jgi:urease accessory protein